jgi:hypothetical protein
VALFNNLPNLDLLNGKSLQFTGKNFLTTHFHFNMVKIRFWRGFFFFPIGRWDLFYCPVPSYLNKTGVFWTIAARSRLLKPGARMIFVRPVLICLVTEIRVDRI